MKLNALGRCYAALDGFEAMMGSLTTLGGTEFSQGLQDLMRRQGQPLDPDATVQRQLRAKEAVFHVREDVAALGYIFDGTLEPAHSDTLLKYNKDKPWMDSKMTDKGWRGAPSKRPSRAGPWPSAP